jgi:ribose 5-phosphate isomerase B
MNIYLVCDHAGFELKNQIFKSFDGSLFNKKVIDFGVFDQQSIDYPEIVKKLLGIFKSDDMAILICGSGIGMSIAANRSIKARAALCQTEEMAYLARAHNDANILVLGSRLIEQNLAFKIVEKFFSTDFEKGRHQKRVDLLNDTSLWR